jgi:hypothetical protein
VDLSEFLTHLLNCKKLTYLLVNPRYLGRGFYQDHRDDTLGEATTTVYKDALHSDYPLPNDLYKKVSDGDFIEVIEWCLSNYFKG